MKYKGFAIILGYVLAFVVICLLILQFTLHEDNLVGTEWVLVSIDGNEISNSRHPTIKFSGLQGVSGSSGCNGYWGSYPLKDGQFRFYDTAVTARWCANEGIMEIESAYFSALWSTTNYAVVRDQLYIQYGDSGELVFIPLDR